LVYVVHTATTLAVLKATAIAEGRGREEEEEEGGGGGGGRRREEGEEGGRFPQSKNDE
jgi:hypothetical protein